MIEADHRSRLTSTLLDLCTILSPIGEERAICDYVAERLGKQRLAGPIRRYGNSIVVPVTRGTGGPHLLLAGHLDVVPTAHDGAPRVEGDKLYGPGASDMKSGLALMIDLIENDREACGKIDLTLVFYAREEGPYLENELGAVIDGDEDVRRADLAVCLEPSDNKLSLGASGCIHATVIFHGKTAHSARPWQGENAIQKAGPFLTELSAVLPRDHVIDGLTYKSVISATLAEGGRGKNIIPDLFTLNVNHRFPPSQTLEEAQRTILDLVAGRAEVRFLDLSPSAPPHLSHPLVQKLASAGVAAIEPKQAWTDVARFATIGVPAVNFGPGENAQAHQRNEWTSIPTLVEGRLILLRWLASL